MKKEEAIKLIAELKKIFEIVRLLDLENMIYTELNDEGELVESNPNCFDFLEKPVICQKCLEAETCKRSIRTEKFEYVDNELYTISSRPITIEDKRYALELLSKEDACDASNENQDYHNIIGELSRRMYVDPVTGILNRRYYEERPHIFRDKNAAALIDIDDFTDICEIHGFATSDRALNKVVEVVKENIRKDDTFIHYGQDTFLIMFKGISSERFLEKMNNIRVDIAEARTELEGLRFTVSIGCALSEDGKELSFDDVDRQVYVAKRMRNAVAYRNKVVYFEGSSFSVARPRLAGSLPPVYSVDYSGTSKQILDVFTREYSSVYEIDLDEDRIYLKKGSDADIQEFGNPEDSTHVFTETVNRYVDKYVSDIDKDWIRHQLSINKLKENLRSRGDIIYTYRVQLHGEELFYRLRVSSLSDSEGIRYAMLGFGDKNREVVNELVMDSLMNDYSSIFVIDLKQNSVRPLKQSSEYHEMNSEGANYHELARATLKYIDPKFKKELYKLADVKYLQEIFHDMDRREIIFKLNKGENPWKKLTVSVIERQKDEAVTIVSCFGDLDHYRIKEIEYQKMIEEQEEILEKTVRERTRELYTTNRQLRKLNEQIVDFVGYVVEGRDFTSGKHIARVKVYTAILASKVRNMLPEYDLSSKDVEAIVAASPLHDLGKVAIPDSLLLKPGKLTDEEFRLMKEHTLIGCDILKKAPKDWDRKTKEMGLEICRSHHERIDGRGYPDGLSGDEIPISAQIVGIADCFDALTSKRPYKAAFSREEAFRMILNGECGAFSEKLLECFKACEEEFMKKR